jgi:hypothetical protein
LEHQSSIESSRKIVCLNADFIFLLRGNEGQSLSII